MSWSTPEPRSFTRLTNPVHVRKADMISHFANSAPPLGAAIGRYTDDKEDQMKNPMLLFVVVTLLLTTSASSSPSAPTFVVGTCKPGLSSYPSISAAVAAAPSGSTVQVCPGTYPEQVTIG